MFSVRPRRMNVQRMAGGCTRNEQFPKDPTSTVPFGLCRPFALGGSTGQWYHRGGFDLTPPWQGKYILHLFQESTVPQIREKTGLAPVEASLLGAHPTAYNANGLQARHSSQGACMSLLCEGSVCQATMQVSDAIQQMFFRIKE